RRLAYLASLVRQSRHVRLDEQKLADRIHQRIQPADVHADGLGEAPPDGIGVERQSGPGWLLRQSEGPGGGQARLPGGWGGGRKGRVGAWRFWPRLKQRLERGGHVAQRGSQLLLTRPGGEDDVKGNPSAVAGIRRWQGADHLSNRLEVRVQP